MNRIILSERIYKLLSAANFPLLNNKKLIQAMVSVLFCYACIKNELCSFLVYGDSEIGAIKSLLINFVDNFNNREMIYHENLGLLVSMKLDITL